MTSNNPFDQCSNCFSKKEQVTSNSNADVNYMLIRALSMNPDGYFTADTCNRLSNGAPKWAIRMLAHYMTPPMYPKRYAYIKKTETKFTDSDKLLIGYIEKFFNLSQRHAEETYLLLKEKGVDMKAIFGQKVVTDKKREK